MGSGRNFRFEKGIHQHLPNCSIHTVDMVYSICPNEICSFHQAKLGDGQNGTKTLRQLMSELNHTNFEIDILKIDIEYGEYLFFNLLFSNNAMNQLFKPLYIRQILIVRRNETFSFIFIFSLQEIHLDRERIFETNGLIHLFKSQNYVIYHKELNRGFPFYACEYGLLKLNRKFFRGHF